MTDSQTMKLVFDHKMQFPSDLKDMINNQTAQLEAQNDRIEASSSQDNQGDTHYFLQLILLDKENGSINENLSSWTAENVTSTEITIKLQFQDLLSVS